MKILSEFEKFVIEQKGTERPYSGEYNDHNAAGVYHCKKCDAPLYLSEHKFVAHCGWPAFDNEINSAVTRVPDLDGSRTEITCSHCDAHLGHVFEGEQLTVNNIRHCVNSISMTFKATKQEVNDDDRAVTLALATFGGGCFWCLEAVFSQLNGVEAVSSGYSGGNADDANYHAVCQGITAHVEVVQVSFDASIITYETLLAVFFSAHDPTTLNRQGNDVGPQYRSAIFVHDQQQAEAVKTCIDALTQQCVFDTPIVTQVTAYERFYPAEANHDNYYANNQQQPYCQFVVRPKVDKIKQLFAQALKSQSAT
ncbi:bifunctional methionine sulfoxide reductase B/A protein [Shewanella intestini]|uniref:Peptide methionine sulfoxide reductase MsrA n=1 Tax=Shewanella intestini TaxID=2017544 RepID=A0ABS5I166_9GAMM|nr:MULTISPECIES: bifunctional methionine sulfoxide reductase B/A protein [Shewanella]MBR9727755.1 bifunctional methionine sulfoxide reductase B/A protein [Shewanella intestini]MRG36252.1 bifunctional methionine sulfoxide reductase B/A protein [Shewanella sp. XMDDZSB0408]